MSILGLWEALEKLVSAMFGLMSCDLRDYLGSCQCSPLIP